MRRIYQLRDQDGQPQGGHAFEAPDLEALEASVEADQLPDGWTREEVGSESEIVVPPPPETPGDLGALL